MSVSAEFTVNGASNPDAHVVAYTSTVTLALVSTNDVSSVQFSIIGGSDSGTTFPTVTSGGIPLGSTATFSMPTDPGDDLGRSFRVRCRVTSVSGELVNSYGVVGALNVNGILPIAAGEQLDRDNVFGWTDAVNAGLGGVASVAPAGDVEINSGFSFGIGTAGSPANNALHILGGTNPTVRLEEVAGSPLLLSEIASGLGLLNKETASGNSILQIDAKPLDGSSTASVNFFRDTSTTGVKAVRVLKGDGTFSTQHKLAYGDDTSICALDGNLEVGSASNPADLKCFGTIYGPITGRTATGNTTVTESDWGTVIYVDSAGAATVTLPEDSTENLPVGFNVGISWEGAGQPTVAVEGADNLRSEGGATKLAAQYTQAVAVKKASGEWRLSGNITT